MLLSPELKSRIEAIVSSAPCVLFMKGSRGTPQCGFSARTVQVLDRLLADYETFDVLSDQEVREGVKEFSDWPTIPQLYIKEEFVGGCDIVSEMYDSGELHEALEMERPDLGAEDVAITISPEAEALLREAQVNQQAELHFGIDAQFQPFLGFGPAGAGQLRVPVGGLFFLLDRDSAARACGASITVVETEHGQRLDVDIPGSRPEPETAADDDAGPSSE